MNQPSTDSARLLELEHRARRLSAICALLGIAVVLLWAWNVAPRSALDAQRFMLRDSVGTWRGALMLREDGSPVVRLNDRNGRARLYGVVTPDGMPRLRLIDTSGVSRIVLELTANGEPSVRLADRRGSTRAQVNLDSTGAPWAQLRWGSRSLSLSPADSIAGDPKTKGPRDRGPHGRR